MLQRHVGAISRGREASWALGRACGLHSTLDEPGSAAATDEDDEDGRDKARHLSDRS